MAPKVVEYDIATSKSEVDLREMVKDAMGDGWQPYGGLSVQVKGAFTYFHQALVKFSAGTKRKSKKVRSAVDR